MSAASSNPDTRPGAFRSLVTAMTSWRTASVSLLSFSSGLPLGLVWIAIPDWMRDIGVDIRIVGLITLAQAPWSFKILWSPLMDRYAPPWLGRRRGWAAISQVALFALTLMLAGVGHHPETPWVIGGLALAIAFASASQDIAIDAYAVDVLRKEEQGVAVGARIAVYRAAMYVAGGVSITLAALYSWPLVNIGLAILFLPMVVITWLSPEPEVKLPSPKTLKDAVWLPFLGFLGRHRALEILAFVVFYKLADNLAGSLLRPFLIDMGYSGFDRGISLATLGLAATVVGTFSGGFVTTIAGLGHSLWIFGLLQIFSNIGYVLVANSAVNRPLMYGAVSFESFTSGLGTGAFSVLLLRMTQKRFSATQFALFSSLFGLPRIFAGPITGLAVDAAGWSWFLWGTIAAGIPGMILLYRFVPFGVKEPEFTVEDARSREPLTGGGLAFRGAVGGVIGGGLGAACLAVLSAIKSLRKEPAAGFDFTGPLMSIVQPSGIGEWTTTIGILLFAIVCAFFTAAVFAARHGSWTVEDAEQAEGQ